MPLTPTPDHYSCVTDQRFQNFYAPPICPITMEPFFMWIEHPEKGWVPTYGGPFDSYMIPETEGVERLGFDNEYSRERFDHDEGCWSENEGLYQRVTTEDVLAENGVFDSE